MTEPLVSIFSGADIVQLPFTSFSSTTQLITSSHGDLERAGEEVLRVYCLQGIEVGLPPFRKAPIFFTIIGQISPLDCYLTQRGRPPAVDIKPESDEDSDSSQPEVASFWFEQRPNNVSALSWQGIGATIRAITNRFDDPNKVNTSRLYHYSTEEHKYRLQFIWYGRPGQSIVNHVRMHSSNGDREELPRSAEEVPYGQPLEVVFTLQHIQRGDGEIIMFACPLRIVRV